MIDSQVHADILRGNEASYRVYFWLDSAISACAFQLALDAVLLRRQNQRMAA